MQAEEALCEVSIDHQSVEAADGVKHLSVECGILGGALFYQHKRIIMGLLL